VTTTGKANLLSGNCTVCGAGGRAKCLVVLRMWDISIDAAKNGPSRISGRYRVERDGLPVDFEGQESQRYNRKNVATD